MAEKNINVYLPVQDDSQSVEFIEVTKTAAIADDVITIEDALANKNNSLQIFVEAATDTSVIILAGNNYPNKILGDKTIPVSGLTVILLEDISRFENRDGSVKIKCAGACNVWATAKRVGMKPVQTTVETPTTPTAPTAPTETPSGE